MAKKKILTIEHVDSQHREEIEEGEFDKLQPRIKEKYTVKGSKEVADTPAEANPQKER